MDIKRNRRRDGRGKRISELARQYTVGETFEVTWQFTNHGDEVWDDSYTFFQTPHGYGFNKNAKPHPMGAARRLAWREITDKKRVEAGETVNLTLSFVAPKEVGEFVCHWQLRDASQNDVGYPVFVRIDVLEAVEFEEPTERGTVPMPPYPFLDSPLQLGMNINPDDPNAHADPKLLKGVTTVRLVFKLFEREKRFARQQWPTTKDYQKLVAEYNAAGINVLFVLNQETVVPKHGWSQWRWLDRWTEQDWDEYVRRFAQIAGQIAGSFKWANANRPNSVSFQIWNEGDEKLSGAIKKVEARNKTLEDAYTLPMDEQQFAKLLTAAAASIKRQDPQSTVVAMGLVSGREPAAHYLRNAHKANPNLLDNVDALAVHPYDCRPRGFKNYFSFASFNHSWAFHEALSDVAAFAREVTGDDFPIWVTEIGPKPRKSTDETTIANYMRATVYDFAVHQPNVEAVFWFPWADFSGTMETSQAGILNRQGIAKADLWDAFEQLRDWLAGEKVNVERPKGEGRKPEPPQPEPPKPPKPKPPIGKQFDIWEYIVGKPGLAHGVRSHDSGGNEHNETVTTVERNGKKLFIKNGVFETIWLADWRGEPYIWRGLDTSPGNGRMYTVWLDGQEGSPWCPRFLRVGEKWESPVEHWVQFYQIDNGVMSALNSGRWRNRIRFYAHYPEMKFVDGVVVKDVIKLGWDGGEKYYYARDRGLVGWAREHHDPHTPQQSGVSEIHTPGSRPLTPIAHANYHKPPQA